MSILLKHARPFAPLALCLTLLLIVGCERYQMRGVVLEGAISTIRVVELDDPRLQDGYPLPLATVDGTLDADRLSRQPLPRCYTEVDGSFAVPVDEAGAGYLDYYVRVIVQKPGYDSAVQDLRVPGPKQRLLVTLSRGPDQYKPDPEDIVDETLRMGEPYMR